VVDRHEGWPDRNIPGKLRQEIGSCIKGNGVLQLFLSLHFDRQLQSSSIFLPCFDTVGWGDRKGIRPVKCWVGGFVGGDDLTGALYVL